MRKHFIQNFSNLCTDAKIKDEMSDEKHKVFSKYNSKHFKVYSQMKEYKSYLVGKQEDGSWFHNWAARTKKETLRVTSDLALWKFMGNFLGLGTHSGSAELYIYKSSNCRRDWKKPLLVWQTMEEAHFLVLYTVMKLEILFELQPKDKNYNDNIIRCMESSSIVKIKNAFEEDSDLPYSDYNCTELSYRHLEDKFRIYRLCMSFTTSCCLWAFLDERWRCFLEECFWTFEDWKCHHLLCVYSIYVQ